MKSTLLVSFALFATIIGIQIKDKFDKIILLTNLSRNLVVESQHLPEVLLFRARELIMRAVYDLHQHHQHGRSHLTRELEQELDSVYDLEKELQAMEQSRHLEMEEVHKIEERLLRHENRLLELSLAVERNHNHELEEGRKAMENRNREGHREGGQIY